MIFQHTHAWILQPSPHTGELKTQTRRIVKPGQGWTEAMAVGVIGKHAGEVLQTIPNFTSRTPYKGREIYAVCLRGRRATIYQVDKDYAVQPGRGQNALYYKRTPHGLSVFDYDSIPKDERPRNLKQYLGDEWLPLRIRITAIRREDVRDISDEDARAEGFKNACEFLRVWCEMHDKKALNAHDGVTGLTVFDIANKWPGINRAMYLHDWRNLGLSNRPAKRYDAWVLTFEAEAQP